MSLLFSEDGEKRLEAFARRGLLCAFDFDGTLAPIVPLPEQAHLPDDIRERLGALILYAPVAIITGRSVDDIRKRLGFEPDFIVGNHGLEGVPGWEAQAALHRELCARWVDQMTRALHQREDVSGIQLEDKQYSLSVHFRMAPDTFAASRALEEIFESLEPRPRLVSGKFVFNLLAQDACHKGSALEKLMQTCGARRAIYVGDDVTDEDVFRLRRHDVLSVRIERNADSAADFYLERPGDILCLIEALSARLGAAGTGNWLRQETAGPAASD